MLSFLIHLCAFQKNDAFRFGSNNKLEGNIKDFLAMLSVISRCFLKLNGMVLGSIFKEKIILRNQVPKIKKYIF